jgi:hypothetical protein
MGRSNAQDAHKVNTSAKASATPAILPAWPAPPTPPNPAQNALQANTCSPAPAIAAAHPASTATGKTLTSASAAHKENT